MKGNKLNHEIENYAWGVLQDMIEREVNAAFKLREEPKMPTKKEIKKIIKQTVQLQREEQNNDKHRECMG